MSRKNFRSTSAEEIVAFSDRLTSAAKVLQVVASSMEHLGTGTLEIPHYDLMVRSVKGVETYSAASAEASAEFQKSSVSGD